jgi:hypothetical protein
MHTNCWAPTECTPAAEYLLNAPVKHQGHWHQMHVLLRIRYTSATSTKVFLTFCQGTETAPVEAIRSQGTGVNFSIARVPFAVWSLREIFREAVSWRRIFSEHLQESKHSRDSKYSRGTEASTPQLGIRLCRWAGWLRMVETSNKIPCWAQEVFSWKKKKKRQNF